GGEVRSNGGVGEAGQQREAPRVDHGVGGAAGRANGDDAPAVHVHGGRLLDAPRVDDPRVRDAQVDHPRQPPARAIVSPVAVSYRDRTKRSAFSCWAWSNDCTQSSASTT